MKKSNNPLLYPLSWLYGLGVGLRNFLFNQGILKQQSYPIPLICVGNITVGGTGKTPHVELLIRSEERRVGEECRSRSDAHNYEEVINDE